MGWSGQSVRVLRHSCNRPNAKMRVCCLDNRVAIRNALKGLVYEIFPPDTMTPLHDGSSNDDATSSSIIVFCMTHARVDAVLTDLYQILQGARHKKQCPLFSSHSGMSLLIRQKNLKGWKEEKNSIMVTCPGLAAGIHHDAVTDVIFVDGFYSLEDFVQGMGRAGRGRE